jgi:hypothetical protein
MSTPTTIVDFVLHAVLPPRIAIRVACPLAARRTKYQRVGFTFKFLALPLALWYYGDRRHGTVAMKHS